MAEDKGKVARLPGYPWLSIEDAKRLRPLLENAIAEVDASAEGDAMIQPDHPFELMEAYDWAVLLLKSLNDYVEKGEKFLKEQGR